MWGAFLGLIAQGLYLYYIFCLVKRPQPPPDPKTAKRQKVRSNTKQKASVKYFIYERDVSSSLCHSKHQIIHFAMLGLSYAVLLYLLIRLCCGTSEAHRCPPI